MIEFPDPKYAIGDSVKILSGQFSGHVGPITKIIPSEASRAWMYRVAVTSSTTIPYYESELEPAEEQEAQV